jgi:hypothetical protein
VCFLTVCTVSAARSPSVVRQRWRACRRRDRPCSRWRRRTYSPAHGRCERRSYWVGRCNQAGTCSRRAVRRERAAPVVVRRTGRAALRRSLVSSGRQCEAAGIGPAWPVAVAGIRTTWGEDGGGDRVQLRPVPGGKTWPSECPKTDLFRYWQDCFARLESLH